MNPHAPGSGAARLHALVTAGPRFAQVFPRRSPGHGNCHAITCAIMLDLIEAHAERGWTWCRGLCTLQTGPTDYVRTDHSWLEHDGPCGSGDYLDGDDGQAVDASSGRVLIMNRWEFRRLVRANVRRERDARQTLKRVQKIERRLFHV